MPRGQVAPDTRVDVGEGYARVLNAQDPSAGDRSAVAAARLIGPDGSLVELARAEAGVSHCPHV